MQYLLTPDQLRELLSLERDHARRRWIDDYWSLRDPIHTTDENEIRAEHERRVAVAQKYFYRAKWPMWDQRGEFSYDGLRVTRCRPHRAELAESQGG
jgi:GWxTD domain-containing protein